jgi:transposase
MDFRDKLSRSEIARRTGLSRNTVKKWLREGEGVQPGYRRGCKPGELSAFKEWLVKALEADALRARRDRRTAKALHAELKTQGYSGGYTILTDFVRAWRQRVAANVSTRAFVPLQFELGEAFQFDWSEERLVVGGIWRKLQVAHLKLCASRAFVLVAYPSQGHEMLFDAHTRSFQALGGVARRGIYDNMKTALDRMLDRAHDIVEFVGDAGTLSGYCMKTFTTREGHKLYARCDGKANDEGSSGVVTLPGGTGPFSGIKSKGKFAFVGVTQAVNYDDVDGTEKRLEARAQAVTRRGTARSSVTRRARSAPARPCAAADRLTARRDSGRSRRRGRSRR